MKKLVILISFFFAVGFTTNLQAGKKCVVHVSGGTSNFGGCTTTGSGCSGSYEVPCITISN